MIMHIVYIDHQNIKLGIRELGRDLDWSRFFVYLKDRYKADQICIFIGYVDKNKNEYEYYKNIGYTLFFKSTYKYNNDAKIKGNIDTLLSHIATKDVINLAENLKKCVLVSGDSDFDVIVKYWIKNNIDYIWMVANDKKHQIGYIVPLSKKK